MGRLLESKQLRAKVSKLKYAIMDTEKSRTECLAVCEHPCHIDKLQDFQNKFLRRLFEVSPSGTPELDGQILSIKWRIVERRLRVKDDSKRSESTGTGVSSLLVGSGKH